MYVNHPYVVGQIAHEYTRDRISAAENRRAVRANPYDDDGAPSGRGFSRR